MPRGDGLLTNELDPHDRGPQDACGVFGVYAPGEEVAKLTYFGLYALQHRGQESAGIAVSNGAQVMVYKDMGLVSQVFDEPTLNSLKGHLAIGHSRYSTTGASVWKNAQPTFRPTAGGGLALGHNGNLTNTDDLDHWLEEREHAAFLDVELPHTNASFGIKRNAQKDSTNDTSLITALMTTFPDVSIEEAAMQVLPRLRGAFSLVFMDEETVYAARDPQGIRPLVLGRLEQGWVVASETAALDIVGASFVREVAPGEMVVMGQDGLRSRTFAEPDPKGCLFEFVYLARPDTTISDQRVHTVRVEIGRELARQHPIEGDLVIPVPESGIPAALGYAEESGIPYGVGLVKNSYVGRTFIQPSQTIRELGIRLKLNPLRDVIAGKRLIVVDDSIVPRHHPARPGADAAGGGGRRGARAHLLPAGALALLLRHRLRQSRRADRQRSQHRGDPPLDRRRLAGLRHAGGTDRVDPDPGRPALPRLLRRQVPRRHRFRRARQAADRGSRRPQRLRPPPDRQPLSPSDREQRTMTDTAQDIATDEPERRSAYAEAGVDIDAGERAVDLMREWVAKTNRPEVLGGIGGFAGLFDASALKAYDHPILATSADGVGTKVAIAQALDVHDTIGFDLIGMLVDDLVVCGAEPLFLTDYIACGRVVPERIAAIVKGIAEACVEAGCTLIGGETAEHPGLLGPQDYDVAGSTTGVVEKANLLGPDRVRAGDALVAMAASGLHSNGYSLVRHVLLERAGWSLDRHVDELGRTLGEELLQPTRVYARHALDLIAALAEGDPDQGVHAMSHITGGGLANNLTRVLPRGVVATVDRSTWQPAPVFGLVRDVGDLTAADVEATLNQGVGMIAVVPADRADQAVRRLGERGIEAWTCGVVESAEAPSQAGEVRMIGRHG